MSFSTDVRQSNAIADVQSDSDSRGIPIDCVGVKSVQHPLIVTDRDDQDHHTVGIFDLYVRLDAESKGTHMSRFIELLNQEEVRLSAANILKFAATISHKLEAEAGYCGVNFPFFVRNLAPISKSAALVDYQTRLQGHWSEKNGSHCRVQVSVPVTSLCPCSKKISDYGAHNQRSNVVVEVRYSPDTPVLIRDLIDIVEANASCRVYGILKRHDEKYVTEHAYDNPKFVEDIVRDISISLRQQSNILGFSVSSENFESIHNHSAYARLSSNMSSEPLI